MVCLQADRWVDLQLWLPYYSKIHFHILKFETVNSQTAVLLTAVFFFQDYTFRGTSRERMLSMQ